MPGENRKLPEIGWAGFEASSAAGGDRRRMATWSLGRSDDAGERATADAARFVTKAKLYEGLGRRPEGTE
jgi:hypothetical protein